MPILNASILLIIFLVFFMLLGESLAPHPQTQTNDDRRRGKAPMDYTGLDHNPDEDSNDVHSQRADEIGLIDEELLRGYTELTESLLAKTPTQLPKNKKLNDLFKALYSGRKSLNVEWVPKMEDETMISKLTNEKAEQILMEVKGHADLISKIELANFLKGFYLFGLGLNVQDGLYGNLASVLTEMGENVKNGPEKKSEMASFLKRKRRELIAEAALQGKKRN